MVPGWGFGPLIGAVFHFLEPAQRSFPAPAFKDGSCGPRLAGVGGGGGGGDGRFQSGFWPLATWEPLSRGPGLPGSGDVRPRDCVGWQGLTKNGNARPGPKVHAPENTRGLVAIDPGQICAMMDDLDNWTRKLRFAKCDRGAKQSGDVLMPREVLRICSTSRSRAEAVPVRHGFEQVDRSHVRDRRQLPEGT